MGLIVFVGMALLVHAGMCWERQKKAELTRKGLITVAGIEAIFGVYFIIASIGHYATW